jgi:hypothetical protein
MSKRMALLVCLTALLAGRAEAAVGTLDNVPAATLLLPYFEVDLASTTGVTTLFSINNSSASAALAHVTMWTDLGVPTVVFGVYLTGYDVQTINVRDIFTGNIARTASAGQDPMDTISNQGQFSQDINFASCTGLLPPTSPSAALLADIQAAHRGLAAPTLFGGNCAGRNLGDNVARGYITVDMVNACTLLTPRDFGYFGGGGVTSNNNQLYGDFFYIDPTNNFAQGDSLVHIEASSTDPQTSVSGQYTFYGRYVGWNASDNREPLGAKFLTRFVLGGAFSGGTRIVAWRDSKTNQAPFACARPPAALGQENILAFDEQENPENVMIASPNPFPASAQRVVVDGAALAVTPSLGWLYLNLNHTGGTSSPSEDASAAQSWVSYVLDAAGRFSVSQPGNLLESATATTHGCLGQSGPPCTTPVP